MMKVSSLRRRTGEGRVSQGTRHDGVDDVLCTLRWTRKGHKED